MTWEIAALVTALVAPTALFFCFLAAVVMTVVALSGADVA
jgi:hypothetical protein